MVYLLVNTILKQDTMVLWSGSPTLDRKVEGSNPAAANLYSELGDQQNAPPTSSLLWHQKVFHCLHKGLFRFRSLLHLSYHETSNTPFRENLGARLPTSEAILIMHLDSEFFLTHNNAFTFMFLIPIFIIKVWIYLRSLMKYTTTTTTTVNLASWFIKTL